MYRPPLQRNEVDQDEFSGRVTLRLTRSLHRKVSEIARKETVSLNQWILATVAEKVGNESSKPNHPVIVHHLVTAQTAILSGQFGSQQYVVTARLNPSLTNATCN
ncbi:type II toxin-antitoxin system HicB family antitoxin [Janthinobacterium lividum]|nr:type II toxin-antitoxin system HicB family antitoxin [Janthinobacterium lividum]